jgi:hypothetical protein
VGGSRVPAPVSPGSVVIRGGHSLIAFDNRLGSIIGAVTTSAIPANTVNYATGAVHVTFEQAPPDGEPVEVFYSASPEEVETPDYTVLSFAGLVNMMTQLLRKYDTWTDLYDSNQGQVLIQLMAYVGNTINYMIGRRAQESYIVTARLRSSLIRLANLLNYRIRRRTGARTTLRFSLKAGEVLADQLFIPSGTQVATAGGIPFITLVDAVIDPALDDDPGKTYVDVEAIQGEWVTSDYTLPANVPPSYRIEVGDSSIEDREESIRVYVGLESLTSAQLENGVNRWGEVTSFIDSQSADRHFVVIYGLDDKISLQFGDGVFGTIPPGPVAGSGASVLRVKHLRTLGREGNISAIGVINTLRSTFTGSSKLTVSNITVASGGDDAQSTEKIRQLAPALFRTGDRAVTREDFTSILLDQPGVVLANVWGEQENDPPNIIWFNRVELAVVMNSDPNPDVPIDWANPSTTQKEAIEEILEAKKVITTYLTWADVVEIMLILSATVYVRDTYSLVDVQRQVREALTQYFAVGQRQLGESVYLSNVVEVIEAIEGVHHVDMQFEEPYVSQNLTDFTTVVAGYSVSANLGVTNLAPGKLFMQYGSHVILDDGDGGLTGDVDPAEAATIDYETGDVVFTIPADSDIGAEATPLLIHLKARVYTVASDAFTAPNPADPVIAGTLTTTPVRPGSVEIIVDGHTIRDTGNGHLVSDDDSIELAETRTINYETGEFTFTLKESAPLDDPISVTYNSYITSRNLIVRRDEFVTLDLNFEDNVSGLSFRYAS